MRTGSHAADLARAGFAPRSDTLFGALVWAVQVSEGETAAAAWVEAFVAGEPPLLISSAFPATEALLTVVPRPVRRSQPPEGVDRKFLQNADFVEASLLPWLDGAPGPAPGPPGGILVTDALGKAPALVLGDRPRVSVDRRSGASEVYRSAATAFGPDARLAVHVLARQAADLERIDRLMVVLGETGIGGERSSGFGRFECERRPAALPLTAEPRGLLLSLFWPTPAEVAAGVLAAPEGHGYRLAERGGWISSPRWATHRSRSVTMLAEGSYISNQTTAPAGGLADVTPVVPLEGRHRVYRYGYGLFLDEDKL
jgi:CRISPR-associated protein Csm4